MTRHARPAERAALKVRVRSACLGLIAGGRIPSERMLCELIPGHGAPILIALRNELRDEGKIGDWGPRGRNPCRAGHDGLTGATAEERAQIERNRRKVKADMLRAWRSGRTTRSRPGGALLGEPDEPREPRVHRYCGPRSRGRARP